mmetsp:Transcript_7795/g.15474  ORF Transcript_7795/g.15474 Transcript_7795/m.15474 type:complete len:162 (+) Transcript_7795:560-1045(+)
MSSVKITQTGDLCGLSRSSVIDTELFGCTSAAPGQTEDGILPLRSASNGTTSYPSSSRTQLAACFDFLVQRISIVPTPGIFDKPCSDLYELRSTPRVAGFFGLRRSQEKGQGTFIFHHKNQADRRCKAPRREVSARAPSRWTRGEALRASDLDEILAKTKK